MKEKRGLVITAATDGACSGNPGPGGWGALMRFEDGSVEELGGHEPQTTNNRMELQAALAVLERLKELPHHPDMTIRTDSKYLINGLSQWIAQWKRKGWRTSSGKPVLNQDLWKALDDAKLANIPLEYVKGHSGDPDNERVDQIAVSFSKGTPIKLVSPNEFVNSKTTLIQAINTSKKSSDTESPKLQQLLSKLELADQLAQKGYGLTLSEISILVNKPIEQLEQKKSAWRWRNWYIEPFEGSLWRLRKHQGKQKGSSKEKND